MMAVMSETFRVTLLPGGEPFPAAQNQTVLLAGPAGLLAGALSMAIGEWVSVTSARELAERELAVEKDELEMAPEEEREELQLIYEAKGVPPDEAKQLSRRLVRDQGAALDTLAREELGIDPEDLGGSATTAAATSFVLFAIGAIIPVASFLFATGWTAVILSVVFSGIALFGIGAAITLFFSVPDKGLLIYLGVFCGFLLYIGASDVLPEAHAEHPSKLTLALTVLGAALMYVVIRVIG